MIDKADDDEKQVKGTTVYDAYDMIATNISLNKVKLFIAMKYKHTLNIHQHMFVYCTY
jgi:hypothetical protein